MRSRPTCCNGGVRYPLRAAVDRAADRLVAILAVLATTRRSRAQDAGLAILAGAFAASLVGVGHGTVGEGRRAHPHGRRHDCISLRDGLDRRAFCLGQVLRQALNGSATPEVVCERRAAVLPVGYWAVALLLLSGCINALILVPRPGKLLTTAYGHVLLVKSASRC